MKIDNLTSQACQELALLFKEKMGSGVIIPTEPENVRVMVGIALKYMKMERALYVEHVRNGCSDDCPCTVCEAINYDPLMDSVSSQHKKS